MSGQSPARVALLLLLSLPGAYAQLFLTCSPGSGPVKVGLAFTATCNAGGGTPPYSLDFAPSGAVPAGLSGATAGPATFIIQGVPAQSGAYTFAVLAQDSATPRNTAIFRFQGTIAPNAPYIAPPPVITTYAGADWVFPLNGVRATDAPLGELLGVVVDPNGNPIIADGKNCVVARIEKNGDLKVLAGNGVCQGVNSGDGGPPEEAALDLPSGLGLAPNGDLYVITAHKIRRISQGVIRTVASYPYLQGEFYPRGSIAIDANRNLFVSDYWNHRILKFTPNDLQANSYTMEVYAGQDRKGERGPETGPALTASFFYPRGVTLDNAGNLYVADAWNNRVRVITPDRMISTAVPNVSAGTVQLDATGNFIISGGCGVFRATPGQQKPLHIAGTPGTCGYGGDNGPARSALITEFADAAPDGLGNIFVADGRRLRKIAPYGTITTVAGNGKYRLSPDGTPRLDAVLNGPASLAVEPNRPFTLFFGEDLLSYKVRKISGGGVSTVAGSGDMGPSRDGDPALAAQIGSPLGLAFDPLGNLYISNWDFNCWCVRKMNPQGGLSKFNSGDIYGARGLAFDRAGNLYAAASGWGGTSKVYKVFPTGQTSDFAGSSAYASTGDGGPASQSLLNYPEATAVDAAGNVYIGEFRFVRVVSPNGEIRTFAGGGSSSADGIPATQAALGQVRGLVFDKSGNLFLSVWSAGGWLVRKISPSGIISTVAGGGPIDQLGDGKIATEASLNEPTGLAFDDAGNLYIADRRNHRIRTVLVTPPAIQISASSLTFSAPSGGAPVTQSVSVFSDEIACLDFGVSIGAGAPWLSVEPGPYATPRLLIFTANPAGLDPNRTYSATVTITPIGATPATLTVNVTFDIGAARNRQLSLSAKDVSFALSRNSAPQTSRLQVSNIGGQTLTYSVAKSPASATWLSAVQDTAMASPGLPSTLTLTANPAGLDPGVYAATLSIQSDGGPAAIRVVMSVSNVGQTVLLSQTGLSFTAVARGGVVPPQSVGVINVGSGTMDWTASTSTTSRVNWLTVSPARGSSTAGAIAAQVTVSVNPPPDLPPGNYYGTVQVLAPGSANRSRLLTVFLKVLQAETPVAAVVQPAELVFRASPGNGAPGSQILELYGINATAKTFKAVRSSGNFKIFPLPGSGTLDPQKPTRLIVQPVANTADGSFPTGTYPGALTLQFNDGRSGNVQVVKLTVISAPAPVPAGAARLGAAADPPPCERQRFKVSVESLNQSFAVFAGSGSGIRVKVVDNCNVPLSTGGTVIAKFTESGEDDVHFISLGGGAWDGTWKPSKQRRNIQMTIVATSGSVSGGTTLSGQSDSSEDPPAIDKDSIVNFYSPRNSGMNAISPGGFLSIYRPESPAANLADFDAERQAPYTVEPLGNAQVFFGATPAPLQFASPGRINVIVPYSVTKYTSTQIRVQRGDALSLPVEFATAVAQPAVYQRNGSAYAYNATTKAPIGASAPAHAGDVLTLYVIGLGEADRTLPDGSISPLSPPARVPGVSVDFGGKPATVEFAGLTPDSVGLYQINIVVPNGISGASVPLTVSIKEQTSPAVNIPVE